jgi:hypothetical protein
MSWEVPAGGSGSANFTCTGLGYDGTNLLIGDFDSERIVKTTLAGAYVGEIILASAPNNSVQGVTYDTSDGTYWVCHYALTNGTIRQYNASGTLLNTISPALGIQGPNGCVYDAVNDRVLTFWPDNVVRGYSCATLSATPVETITLSGHSGTFGDGITLDPSSPSTRLWVTIDGAVEAAPAYLAEINRATGAVVSTVVIPSSCEGLTFVGSALYTCHDQTYHLGVTNGNRVWTLSTTTGNETAGFAVQVASGSFTLATATGNQAVGGIGFVPKVVFVFGMFNGAGITAGELFGVADNKTRQWAMCARSNDGVTPTQNDRAWDSTLFIASTDGNGVYAERAAFGSVTHDGFALGVTSPFGAARRIHYLAIGGDDAEAYVGKFDLAAATGNQAVTGVPFEPSCVLLSAGMSSTTEGVASDESRFAIGAMTATAQWCMSTFGRDNQAASDEQGVGRTDAAIVRINQSLATTALASYVSLDAGGFTVNTSTAPGVAVRVGYVALGGAALYAIGAFNQPTSTGNQAITGVGFEPLGELFVGTGRVASTTPTAGSRTMVGAAVSSSNRRSYATTAQDAVNPSNSARDASETAALIAMSDGGTPTRLATADFVSQDADGFTVNWSAADATARQNFYLAISEVPATVPDAPTIGTAAATGSTTANVPFTAPANDGGAAITGYTATSTPGGITGTLAQAGSGTIPVSGLSASTSYTFTVRATNSVGDGAESAASNSITTSAPSSGQAPAIRLLPFLLQG